VKSHTDRFRVWNMILLSAAVLVSLAGWLLGKDPGQLAFLLGTLATTAGIGEASKHAKRTVHGRKTDGV
jgi:hypothetical protein